MKILTVNYEYPPVGGGGGVAHEQIAEELAKRHRVVAVTSGFGGLPRRETRQGVEIIRVPVWRKEFSVASAASLLCFPPMAWGPLWRLLRRETFDLVHSHFVVPTGVGSLPPALLTGTPHVLSIHGGDIYDPSKRLSPHRLPVVRSVVRQVLKRSTVVVAQSTNTRDNAYERYAYDGPIEILPLGIKEPVFNPADRSELGLPADRFVAVTVGRLIRRKAIDRLLQSLAHPDCDGVDLVVVGEGPERPALEELARSLGLRARVRFTGHVTEERKWQLLDAADAYVSSTLHEGFGLVYLEAMCVGLPVVTFDHGGQVDFLRDGENGALVTSGDVAALGAALARLSTDPETVARIRETNLAQAPHHFVERCAERYETLFEGILAGTVPQTSAAATA